MSDFETGMLKAMREVFPQCERSGCNFHMAQALFRKGRSMGLFNLFDGENEEANAQRKAVYKTFRWLKVHLILYTQKLQVNFGIGAHSARPCSSCFRSHNQWSTTRHAQMVGLRRQHIHRHNSIRTRSRCGSLRA